MRFVRGCFFTFLPGTSSETLATIYMNTTFATFKYVGLYWCLIWKYFMPSQETYCPFFRSIRIFHLSMVVNNHFPKKTLKWCLVGALLELTVNCSWFVDLFWTINEPNQPNYSQTWLDHDQVMITRLNWTWFWTNRPESTQKVFNFHDEIKIAHKSDVRLGLGGA